MIRVARRRHTKHRHAPYSSHVESREGTTQDAASILPRLVVGDGGGYIAAFGVMFIIQEAAPHRPGRRPDDHPGHVRDQGTPRPSRSRSSRCRNRPPTTRSPAGRATPTPGSRPPARIAARPRRSPHWAALPQLLELLHRLLDELRRPSRRTCRARPASTTSPIATASSSVASEASVYFVRSTAAAAAMPPRAPSVDRRCRPCGDEPHVVEHAPRTRREREVAPHLDDAVGTDDHVRHHGGVDSFHAVNDNGALTVPAESSPTARVIAGGGAGALRRRLQRVGAGRDAGQGLRRRRRVGGAFQNVTAKSPSEPSAVCVRAAGPVSVHALMSADLERSVAHEVRRQHCDHRLDERPVERSTRDGVLAGSAYPRDGARPVAERMLRRAVVVVHRDGGRQRDCTTNLHRELRGLDP